MILSSRHFCLATVTAVPREEESKYIVQPVWKLVSEKPQLFLYILHCGDAQLNSQLKVKHYLTFSFAYIMEPL